MNHRFSRAALSSALVALALLSGCKSTGAEKVDQTSTRLDQFRTGVETLKGQVTGTADALAQVVATAATDPKPAFKEFSKQVDLVSSSTTKARTNLDKAQSEGAKLFEEWTKRLDTITDPDIRQASEKRRDDLKKALSSVAEEANPALTSLEAYVATTKDLHTYLSQDLTPAGIESIAGKSKDLGKSAKSIAEDLDDVIEAASKVASQFATAKPPPPQAK